ncbi:MAG: trypsin-like serine protease [Longispora sp.]|nr:trypsin-like serine protease [Longispora sp. (in: high G+C Gram-positive bacteria)]
MRKGKLFGVIVAAFIASATLSATPVQAIWGGRQAELQDAPGIVSVHTIKGGCAGVLVWPSWALTAKHCFNAYEDKPNVRGGTLSENRKGKSVDGDRVYRHSDADLALVHLESPLEGIATAELPTSQSQVEAGTIITAAGWGYIDSARSKFPQVLQATTFPACDPGLYFDTVQGSTRHPNLIVGLGENTGVMRGDSGGPMYVNGKLVAITKGGKSWSELETGNKTDRESDTRFSVGVRVAPYAEWILDVVANHND